MVPDMGDDYPEWVPRYDVTPWDDGWLRPIAISAPTHPTWGCADDAVGTRLTSVRGRKGNEIGGNK